MSSDADQRKVDGDGLDRRSFLRNSGGVASGLAVTVVPGALVLASPATAGAHSAHPVEPNGEMPEEPVVAYVHNADRGEVTVVSGTTERTYHDPALAKRLLDAAHRA